MRDTLLTFEGGAHGALSPTGLGLGKEDVGDVGAHDEEDEGD